MFCYFIQCFIPLASWVWFTGLTRDIEVLASEATRHLFAYFKAEAEILTSTTRNHNACLGCRVVVRPIRAFFAHVATLVQIRSTRAFDAFILSRIIECACHTRNTNLTSRIRISSRWAAFTFLSEVIQHSTRAHPHLALSCCLIQVLPSFTFLA